MNCFFFLSLSPRQKCYASELCRWIMFFITRLGRMGIITALVHGKIWVPRSQRQEGRERRDRERGVSVGRGGEEGGIGEGREDVREGRGKVCLCGGDRGGEGRVR